MGAGAGAGAGTGAGVGTGGGEGAGPVADSPGADGAVSAAGGAAAPASGGAELPPPPQAPRPSAMARPASARGECREIDAVMNHPTMAEGPVMQGARGAQGLIVGSLLPCGEAFLPLEHHGCALGSTQRRSFTTL